MVEKNAAGERSAGESRKHLRLAQTGVFENFRRVAVGEKAVDLEIFNPLRRSGDRGEGLCPRRWRRTLQSQTTPAPGASKPAWVRGRRARITLVA